MEKDQCHICMSLLTEQEEYSSETEEIKRVYGTLDPEVGMALMVDERPVEEVYADILKMEQQTANKTNKPNLMIFILDKCTHVFHGKCLSTYFKHQIDESKFPLVCPDTQCKK